MIYYNLYSYALAELLTSGPEIIKSQNWNSWKVKPYLRSMSPCSQRCRGCTDVRFRLQLMCPFQSFLFFFLRCPWTKKCTETLKLGSQTRWRSLSWPFPSHHLKRWSALSGFKPSGRMCILDTCCVIQAVRFYTAHNLKQFFASPILPNTSFSNTISTSFVLGNWWKPL